MKTAIARPIFLAVGLALVPLVQCLGQKAVISFTEVQGAFQIAGGEIEQPQIRVSEDDYWGVIRAAGDLASDFGKVTGSDFSLSNGESGAEPAVYGYRPITTNYTHVSAQDIKQLAVS
jgi:hypothetical protein